MKILISDAAHSGSKFTKLRDKIAFDIYFNLCLSFYLFSCANSGFEESLVRLQRNNFMVFLKVLQKGYVFSSLLMEEGRFGIHVKTYLINFVASIIVHSHHYLPFYILFLPKIVFKVLQLFQCVSLVKQSKPNIDQKVEFLHDGNQFQLIAFQNSVTFHLLPFTFLDKAMSCGLSQPHAK